MTRPVPVMTQEEWHLFAGAGNHPLTTLGFITGFKHARSQAVAGSGGGTFYFRDGTRGWHQTLSKGMVADDELINYYGHDPKKSRVFVPWTLVEVWSKTVAPEVRTAALDIMARRRALYDEHPPLYPSIGRPYCWAGGRTPTDEERQRDYDDMAKVRAEREALMVPWRAAMAVLDDEAKALIQSLAPTLLDDLVLVQRRAAAA